MEAKEFGVVLLLICLFMLVLASILVIFFLKYRQNLLRIMNEKQFIAFKAAVEAEDKQKSKIANDLHDEIIHKLTAIKQLTDRESVDMHTLSLLLDQSISGVRNIALDLFPKTLSNFGLINALEQHAIILNKSKLRKIDIENTTPFNRKLPFSDIQEVHIFRLSLEIISNLVKHANFNYLLITFGFLNDEFTIDFTHDGLGVTDTQIELLSATSDGLGLKSVSSRAFILNARINYFITKDNCTIKVKIPCKHEG